MDDRLDGASLFSLYFLELFLIGSPQLTIPEMSYRKITVHNSSTKKTTGLSFLHLNFQ
jgi:hypothetical protein